MRSRSASAAGSKPQPRRTGWSLVASRSSSSSFRPHDPARQGRRTIARRCTSFDQARGAVLLLQGLDDPVVPANQAEMMLAALQRAGVPCAYIGYPGEQHGFREGCKHRADARSAAVLLCDGDRHEA
ncbi:MAG: alpha/beta hydrolase family protein [Candidatus Dormibacteria bacterium]